MLSLGPEEQGEAAPNKKKSADLSACESSLACHVVRFRLLSLSISVRPLRFRFVLVSRRKWGRSPPVIPP